MLLGTLLFYKDLDLGSCAIILDNFLDIGDIWQDQGVVEDGPGVGSVDQLVVFRSLRNLD